MSFKITIDPTFKRRLQKKTPQQQGAILKCIERLGNDPTHPGLHTGRIQGAASVWEARVDEANRVTWKYGSNRGEIVLLNHCKHDLPARGR